MINLTYILGIIHSDNVHSQIVISGHNIGFKLIVSVTDGNSTGINMMKLLIIAELSWLCHDRQRTHKWQYMEFTNNAIQSTLNKM